MTRPREWRRCRAYPNISRSAGITSRPIAESKAGSRTRSTARNDCAARRTSNSEKRDDAGVEGVFGPHHHQACGPDELLEEFGTVPQMVHGRPHIGPDGLRDERVEISVFPSREQSLD